MKLAHLYVTGLLCATAIACAGAQANPASSASTPLPVKPGAQTGAPSVPGVNPPQLTELERVTVENKLLRFELLKREIQEANTQIQQLDLELNNLIASFKKYPGWTFNKQTLVYEPEAKKEKK